MQRGLLKLLTISVILLATTFAGMAVFGMDSGMAMDGGMSGIECVGHCLASVPVSSPMPIAPLIAFAVAMATFFLAESLVNIGSVTRALQGWHADIGKFLLHQNLSTIVLRN